MSRYFRRKTPGKKENLEAGAVAAGLALGVGTVVFYFVRLFLSREPISPRPERARPEELPSSDSEERLHPDSEERLHPDSDDLPSPESEGLPSPQSGHRTAS